jgi:thymidylate synthase (FAD)
MTPFADLIYYTQVNPLSSTARKFKLVEPCDLIEFSGRWDYGLNSIKKMGDRSIITRWMNSGEESMVEMVDAVFFIECSRVVSHELVRHRIASYQQESQRFVAYVNEDEEEMFYLPPELEGNIEAVEELRHMYKRSSVAYDYLRSLNVPKQLARYVLPNATRTRIIMKTNLREWRHILKLRLHSSAQPEMIALMDQIHDQLFETFPIIFEDIRPWLASGERAGR